MIRAIARPAISGPTVVILVVLVVLLVSGVPSSVSALVSGGAGEATYVGPPVGARQTFSDEFDGANLDSTKWITCYPWASASGCTNASTSELEWYNALGVSASGGALHLTARRQEVAANHKQYAYTSGMVASAGKFQFTYGYVEFRAWIPSGRGLWPALWLLPADQSWPPEIDVMEALGGNTNRADLTYHPVHGAPERRHVSTGNLSAGWHVFAVDWRPGSIVWSVDGRARFKVSGSVPTQPMYLVMDLAVSGTQRPDRSTPFPSSLDVDYVRVWQPG
jgi:beta-glucanase (GH16 family)